MSHQKYPVILPLTRMENVLMSRQTYTVLLPLRRQEMSQCLIRSIWFTATNMILKIPGFVSTNAAVKCPSVSSEISSFITTSMTGNVSMSCQFCYH